MPSAGGWCTIIRSGYLGNSRALHGARLFLFLGMQERRMVVVLHTDTTESPRSLGMTRVRGGFFVVRALEHCWKILKPSCSFRESLGGSLVDSSLNQRRIWLENLRIVAVARSQIESGSTVSKDSCVTYNPTSATCIYSLPFSFNLTCQSPSYFPNGKVRACCCGRFCRWMTRRIRSPRGQLWACFLG